MNVLYGWFVWNAYSRLLLYDALSTLYNFYNVAIIIVLISFTHAFPEVLHTFFFQFL